VAISSTTAAEAATPDRAQLDGLLGKVIPFAKAADALACRTVGKVRTLALLGMVSSLWIAYACTSTFDWRLATTLIVFVPLTIPSAILWKIHGMLSSVVGLPQRIADTAYRLHGKAIEYRELYESRSHPNPIDTKPKFRQLCQTGRSFLEARALTGEAQEIVTLAGGAVALANPVFAIVLACTSAVTLLLISMAAAIGLAYLI